MTNSLNQKDKNRLKYRNKIAKRMLVDEGQYYRKRRVIDKPSKEKFRKDLAKKGLMEDD